MTSLGTSIRYLVQRRLRDVEDERFNPWATVHQAENLPEARDYLLQVHTKGWDAENEYTYRVLKTMCSTEVVEGMIL